MKCRNEVIWAALDIVRDYGDAGLYSEALTMFCCARHYDALKRLVLSLSINEEYYKDVDPDWSRLLSVKLIELNRLIDENKTLFE